MTLIPPEDYRLGLKWMRNLDSSSSEIKLRAEQSFPKKFSGNSDTHYSCADLADDRVFFSSERGWSDKSLLKLENILNKKIHLRIKDLSVSRFIRDSSVTLFPRGFLIPYSIKDPVLLNRFLAMLPESSDPFILMEKGGTITHKEPYGSGFKKKNIIAKMRMCYEFHIPFIQGKTCIEGGTVFFLCLVVEKRQSLESIVFF